MHQKYGYATSRNNLPPPNAIESSAMSSSFNSNDSRRDDMRTDQNSIRSQPRTPSKYSNSTIPRSVHSPKRDSAIELEKERKLQLKDLSLEDSYRSYHRDTISMDKSYAETSQERHNTLNSESASDRSHNVREAWQATNVPEVHASEHSYEHSTLTVPQDVFSRDKSALMEIADDELLHAAIIEHARVIGIDPDMESEYLWIAKESLIAPLPEGWHAVTATDSGEPYYYSELNGESQWDHPCDEQFRQFFRDLKERRRQEHAAQQRGFSAEEYGDESFLEYSAAHAAVRGRNDRGYSSTDNAQYIQYNRPSHVAYDDKNAIVERSSNNRIELENTIEALTVELEVAQAKVEELAAHNAALSQDSAERRRNGASISTNEDEKNELLEQCACLKKCLEERDEAYVKLQMDWKASIKEHESVIQNFKIEREKTEAVQAAPDMSQVVDTNKQTEIPRDKDKELKQLKTLVKRLRQERDELRLAQTKPIVNDEVERAGYAERAAVAEKNTQDLVNELDQLQLRCEKLETEKLELKRELAERSKTFEETRLTLESRHEPVKQELHTRLTEIGQLRSCLAVRDKELEERASRLEILEKQHSNHALLIEQARKAGYEDAERTGAVLLKQAIAEKDHVSDLYTHEVQERRKLHNRLIEIQGNIRVFCRVRPVSAIETKSDNTSLAVFFRDRDPQTLELHIGSGSEHNEPPNSPPDTLSKPDSASSNYAFVQKYAFEFDHVFQPGSSQSDVFEQTRELITSALDGFNVCIFAYGQTGSGKTYTMEGSVVDRGVNHRALQELFRLREERAATGAFDCTLKLSILEVYNELVVDLLQKSSRDIVKKGLDIRVSKQSVYVENLTDVEVKNDVDVIDLMEMGHSHRSVGSHDVNEHSSRSHLVLSISIETHLKSENRTLHSTLHLIDLAGSERVGKTAASGQRLKEAQNINRSLSALGDVIAALGSNSKHVPYRNSKLTFLLQNSLSKNSKVLMFVNVSPVQWNAWESLCSLNFASRCRNVVLGQAKVNHSSTAGGSATPQSGTKGTLANKL